VSVKNTIWPVNGDGTAEERLADVVIVIAVSAESSFAWVTALAAILALVTEEEPSAVASTAPAAILALVTAELLSLSVETAPSGSAAERVFNTQAVPLCVQVLPASVKGTLVSDGKFIAILASD
jgi:hypothetical protein